jgi:hypothetical protein
MLPLRVIDGSTRDTRSRRQVLNRPALAQPELPQWRFRPPLRRRFAVVLHTDAERQSGGRKMREPSTAGSAVRLLRSAAIARLFPQLPLTGEPHRLTFLALRLQLPDRIAAAFPANGRRGRPSRPAAKSILRGVLARAGRRQGLSDTQIAVALSCDRKALRRAEAEIQRMERAEGVSTPCIRHDSRAFQTLWYARRRFAEALGNFDRVIVEHLVVCARKAPGSTRGLETLCRSVRYDPRFFDAASELKSLAAAVGRAEMDATGRMPSPSLRDPDSNAQEAANYTARATTLRLAPRLNLSRSVVEQLPADPRKCADVVQLIAAQQAEQASERSRRFLMPGSGRRWS